MESLLDDTELREHLRDEYFSKIPDLDKLYSKFYKVKSGLRHNATLGDCVKVYQLVVHSQNVAKYLSNTYFLEMSDFLKENTLKDENHPVHEIFVKPFMEEMENFRNMQFLIDSAIDMERATSGEYVIVPEFHSKLKDLQK